MLKRYQVLLPDWLEDYIKFGSEQYDLSFSEVIRLELCISIIGTISELSPGYKPDISLNNIMEAAKKNTLAKLDREEVHRYISKIYFEARKAIEYRMSDIKKHQKK